MLKRVENTSADSGIQIFMPMSTAGSADGRFSLYVEELREFFALSGVSFGAPEDVCSFIEMLSKTGSFRGETFSMVRSIIYRELGKIQKPELKRLVLTAVGGIDPSATIKSSENVDALLNQLEEFINRAFISDPDSLDLDKPADRQNVDEAENSSSAEVDRFHAPELPMPQWLNSVKKEVVDDFPQADPSAGKSLKMPRRPLTTSFYSRARLVASDAMETSDAPGEREEFPIKAQFIARQFRWALGLVTIASLSVASGFFYDRYQHHAPPTLSNSQSTNKLSISSTAASSSSASESKARVPSAVSKRSHTVTNPKITDQPVIVTGRTALEAGDGFRNKPAAGRTGQRVDLRHLSESSPALLSGDEGSAQSLPTERSEYPTRRQFGGRSGMSYSSGIMNANAVSVVPPKYPRLASFAHVQGTVVMQAVIARDGTVAATHVLSGPRLLRGAAISAVRRWRYRPFGVNGQSAEVATIVTVDFRLPRH